MWKWRPAGLLLVGALAVHAQKLEPIIERPVTLPAGTVDLTLHGTYTNWNVDVDGHSLAGETLALAAEVGVTDQAQLGLAVAFPLNPGAAFGSIVASVAAQSDRHVAFRMDGGIERFAQNGGDTPPDRTTNRYFAGFGPILKVPITSTVAFVTGRGGAAQFGHFSNVGLAPYGLYTGATYFPEAGSDMVVVSYGDNPRDANSNGPRLGINLPAGLLLQPDPHVAVTLQAGYTAVIALPASRTTQTFQFVPLGIETVVSPLPAFDVGARLFLDGLVAYSGPVGTDPGFGYTDLLAVMFWIRVRAFG